VLPTDCIIHNEYEIKTMKTTMKKLATATLMLLAVATVQAQPIVLPDPAAGANESGTFTISPKNEITLIGNPITLHTNSAAKGNDDIAGGSARFTSGDLQYSDGASTVDGQVSKVAFGSEVKGGQVVYTIKGLVFGKLTQAGQIVDVSGNFSVSTKAAAEGTTLAQAQVDSSHLVLTIRSNVNNTQPASPEVQQQHGHDRNRSRH
jgi:hypothetical protein